MSAAYIDPASYPHQHTPCPTPTAVIQSPTATPYNTMSAQYATTNQQPPTMQSQSTQPQTPPQSNNQMTLGSLLQVCHKLLDYPLNNIHSLLQHDIPTQLNAVEAGLNTAITTYPHLTQQLEPYIKSVKHKKQQIELLTHQARRQQQIALQQQQYHSQQQQPPIQHYQSQQPQQYYQQQPVIQQYQQHQHSPYPNIVQPINAIHPQQQQLNNNNPQAIQYAQHPIPDSTTPVVSLDHLIFHHPGNRYTKIRKLRATLFGHVSLYKDTETDQLVAVKLSSKELMIKRVTAKGKPVSENPLDEMKFMRKLNQPLNNHNNNSNNNINNNNTYMQGAKYVLRLLDECDDGTHIWTVLEFAQEGELFDYVEQCDGRLDASLVRRLFVEMVYGVQYMHICGICHLDLSLENLLLTGDHDNPDVKICDFGLARFLQYTTTTQQRASSSVELPYSPALGTKPGKLGYMSPEVFAGSPFYGTLSDVWSMGVILFILLTGVPPYEVPSYSDGRFAMIMNPTQGVKTLLSRWNMLDKVNDIALDLLTKVLTTQEKRISIQQIVQHPYFTQNNKH